MSLTATTTPASTVATRSTEAADSPSRPLHRLTVDQYDRMVQLGILNKNDRSELIEGRMVEKIRKSNDHHLPTQMLRDAFQLGLPAGWFALSEAPIRLARSVPEPDVMVVRGHILDLLKRKLRVDDLALIVEVSDSSYDEDRTRRHYYAESGVSLYWIANIPDPRIEVYSDQSGSDYATRQDFGWNDVVTLKLDDETTLRLPVNELMTPPEEA